MTKSEELIIKLLIFIAGELAIVNTEKHLSNHTNKVIVSNIEELANDFLKLQNE